MKILLKKIEKSAEKLGYIFEKLKFINWKISLNLKNNFCKKKWRKNKNLKIYMIKKIKRVKLRSVEES